jgi:subtilase family serine protease
MSERTRMRRALAGAGTGILVSALAGAWVGCSSDRPSRSTSSVSPPASLIVSPIDETKLMTLVGNTGPRPTPLTDQGPVDDARVFQGMQLVLQRALSVEAELEALIDAMHTPHSPSFHKWLTAQEFGARFGASDADIATLTAWLESHGFHVEGVPAGRTHVVFTGTAAQIRDAFHTEMHALIVGGKTHLASAGDPQIPAALAPIVYGVHGLHDFFPQPMVKTLGPIRRIGHSGQWELVGTPPQYTITGSTTYYALAPADLATIYGFPSGYPSVTAGHNQTIAVVEDSMILHASGSTNDIGTFRTDFAPALDQFQPPGTDPCANPGYNGAEGEAALDVEWSGAAAPGATIELAACADTATIFGPLAAVQNLVNGVSPPPIISMSYGECEAQNGSAVNQSVVSTYQQAAAEGISVFVSAGDSGAALCDAVWGDNYATVGISANGYGSTPYNLSAGGTDFMDTYDAAHGGPAVTKYWNASNTSTYGSAKSYVPEIPWNNTCASSLIYTSKGYAEGYGASGFCSTTAAKSGGYVALTGGSGAPSSFSAQPSWQTSVPGIPSTGHRYLPDVSLFAANGVWNHYYVFCMSDTANGGTACTTADSSGAGGTSFVAPILAGIQALLNQAVGGVPQGNPAPMYYQLAATQYASSLNCNSGTAPSPTAPNAACVFYDVTAGDSDQPCAGTQDCFGDAKVGAKNYYGVMSSSDTSLQVAYAAGVGWDYSTGLGTLNVNNLINAWLNAVQ